MKIPQTLNTYNFSTNEKLLSPLSNTSYVADVLDIDRKKAKYKKVQQNFSRHNFLSEGETVMSGWPILLPLCEAFKTYGGNLVPEK